MPAIKIAPIEGAGFFSDGVGQPSQQTIASDAVNAQSALAFSEEINSSIEAGMIQESTSTVNTSSAMNNNSIEGDDEFDIETGKEQMVLTEIEKFRQRQLQRDK